MGAVQARLNIDTTGFAIYEYPASRRDDGTVEQDAGRAAVLAQYTLMGKKPVTVPVTGTADGGNTGNGTVTGVAVAPGGPPRAGSWNLEATAAGEAGRVVGANTPDAGNTGDGLVTAFSVTVGEVPEVGNFVLTCTDADAGGTATAGTATPGGGDTGDGAPGVVTPAADVKEGTYTLTCVTAAANAGRFTVTDPDGEALEDLTVAVAYTNTHFGMTIADGANDFIVGDSFTIAMTIANGGLFTLVDPNGASLLENIELPGGALGTIAVVSGGISFTLNDGATDFAVDDFFTLAVAVADGGTFKLEDPGGNIVANDIVMSGTAGGATTFIRAGMTFIITDGATDFASGDKFAIVVVVNGKSVPFDISAIDGSEIPESIMMADDITAAALVAADVVDVPMVFTGMKFDEDKLIFDDGTTTLDSVLSNGRTVRDQLALATLIPQQTQTASTVENT